MSQISPQKPSLSSQNSVSKPNFIQQRLPWLYAFWKFSRPHTIIGTSLSVFGLYTIARAMSQGQWAIDSSWLTPEISPFATLLACLCGNIYIVGLNQLEDVAIDQINKPHLPLASGEFSRREGQWIVAIAGGLAIWLSVLQGYFLLATVGSSLLIGTAYSLPPIRLKRSPFWASLCIFSVRGAIVNLGLFLHFHQQFQGRSDVPPVVWALTLFILGFTFAIAIFKDIPDLEGDRRYHINTLTIRLGQAAVFNLARWVISFCYVSVILAAIGLPGINAPFLILTHLLALGALWFRSRSVDLKNKTDIARCYQFIWKLFFLEYLIFPIACLLGSS
jgi:homogentisate phytyltransferase / homogentisate geranylgeranyltransferase